MGDRILYRKRPERHVTAVQLDLDFDTFQYRKWGNVQACAPGDWLVNNNNSTYTIKKEVFQNTYKEISQGLYEKIGEVWAETAEAAGTIETREGATDYRPGDYLVFDRTVGGKGYAVEKHRFEYMYEPVTDEFQLSREQQDYLDTRILPSIEKSSEKARLNRRRFHQWQSVAIIAATLVPVFTVIGKSGDNLSKVIVALLGSASALSAGILSLFKFQENWIRHKSTAQDLESHLSQFKLGTGVYQDRRRAFNLLADNCERILNAKRGQWAEKRPEKKPAA